MTQTVLKFPDTRPVPPELPTVSRSSLVLALLTTLGTVDPALPAEFTADDVERALGLPHHDGAVTGFLSRAETSGMLRLCGHRRAGRYVYALADASKAPRVRTVPSHGSKLGKTHRGAPRATMPELGDALAAMSVAPATPHAADDRARLLELASELTDVALRLNVEVSLQAASTEQLLCELGRRAGCAVRLVAE